MKVYKWLCDVAIIKDGRLSPQRSMALVITTILVTSLAILLDIPILRQVLGFFYCVILPGATILIALKLDKLGLAEKIVLTIGISIAFLMFVGVGINFAYFSLGYKTPLSVISLVLSFSAILAGLCILAYKRNKAAFSPPVPALNLDGLASKLFIMPIIFPFLSIIGARIMDSNDNNFMLLALLTLIPIYVILMMVAAPRIPKGAYPFALFMIGISLLFMYTFRSNHIMGNDIHAEYWKFQQIFSESHYIVSKSFLGSVLSITILPVIFQSLLGIDGEQIFRIVYPLLLSLTPLCIYIAAKKYITEPYAFLAAFFFIAQTKFYHITDLRSPLSIFFLALAVMVLLNDKISQVTRSGLFLVMLFAMILSHYASAFIFAILLPISWLISELLTKRLMARRYISGYAAMTGLVVTFIWYSQIFGAPFDTAVLYLNDTALGLKDMFISEVRSEMSQAILTLASPSITARVHTYIGYLTIAFMAVGLLAVARKYAGLKRHSTSHRPNMDLWKTGLDLDYVVLAALCFFVLSAAVLIPQLSNVYDTARFYALVLVFLSILFVIGGITISEYLKFRWTYVVILLVLIPYFMFTTGVAYRVAGIHHYVHLSSEGGDYNRLYIHEQEVYAIEWFEQHRAEGNTLYADWVGSEERLVGRIPGMRVLLLELESNIGDNYIYLRYYNIANEEVLGQGAILHKLAEYSDMLSRKGRIYANSGSEIYK